MQFLSGKPRDQLYLIPTSLEEVISSDNEARTLDAFVSMLDLQTCGFQFPQGKGAKGGRPAYHPSVLLKLYLYGYMNRIRSSRALERECGRNIELMWLMEGLVPDHNTIANFRKDNAEPIREVFRSTVRTADSFKLIGKKLIAGDSTKLRAQNSKKNNYNEKKIERHLKYIEEKLAEYQRVLDGADSEHSFSEAVLGIQRMKKQARRYRQLQQHLRRSGEKQISTSDPDSRQLITRNNITEVAYNVQTTVDAEHKLVVDYLVTNTNDSKAMGTMLERAVGELGTSDFTALYDKGYHTGTEFKKANELEVKVMVAIPDVASQAPNPEYNLEAFVYDTKKNRYTCPQGHVLRSNGQWYTKHHGLTKVKVQHFKTNRCKTCPVKDLCTKNEKGRLIERSEYAGLIEANKARINADPATYKLRQQLVEHPYGTIKRQWGFDHVMTKRYLERASADIGLIFTAYNLRRLMTIFSPSKLRELFKALKGLKQAGFTSFRTLWAMWRKRKANWVVPLNYSYGRLLVA